jgi:hypothetical protein
MAAFEVITEGRDQAGTTPTEYSCPRRARGSRTYAFLLGFPPEPIPGPADVALVHQTTRLGAENERRWLLPVALQRGLLALFEEIAKHAIELVRHHDESSASALRGSELATNEGAPDVDAGIIETNVFLFQSESLAPTASS